MEEIDEMKQELDDRDSKLESMQIEVVKSKKQIQNSH